ncbi:MAG: succinoglycan biosynthesis protein ExoM [Gammaproteobacteria bacterium]|jgi:succinoglycan biosynthesis protein ExoM
MKDVKRIVVGIPTFKRPDSLKRLLESIANQQTSLALHILVADNEGDEGSGLAVINSTFAEGFPYPLSGIAVRQRGISAVRNALIDFAFGELAADGLAMIDDDERVCSVWISRLVEIQKLGGFDVVAGTVLSEFEVPPPDWMSSLSIYHRKTYPEGPIPMIYGTGNIFLARSFYQHYPGFYFDHAFGLSGGGDAEFFTRLKLKGASFGYSPESISYEFVNESRMTKAWAIQRAYRIGSSEARIFVIHAMSLKKLALQGLKISTALVLSPLLYILFIWSPSRRMEVVLLMVRQLGKLNGFFGKPMQYY